MLSSSHVPVCPTVRNAKSRILTAALTSRSNSNLHFGHLWVLVDSVLDTAVPQPEQAIASSKKDPVKSHKRAIYNFAALSQFFKHFP